MRHSRPRRTRSTKNDTPPDDRAILFQKYWATVPKQVKRIIPLSLSLGVISAATLLMQSAIKNPSNSPTYTVLAIPVLVCFSGLLAPHRNRLQVVVLTLLTTLLTAIAINGCVSYGEVIFWAIQHHANVFRLYDEIHIPLIFLQALLGIFLLFSLFSKISRTFLWQRPPAKDAR